MMNTLSSALAHAIVEDRLRSAHEHRSHRATAGLPRLRVALATVNWRLPLGTRKPLPC